MLVNNYLAANLSMSSPSKFRNVSAMVGLLCEWKIHSSHISGIFKDIF